MKYDIGSTVLDNWIIKKLLGEGSYGKVYEIERTDFGITTRSALKIMTVPYSETDIMSAYSDGMDEKSVASYFRGVVEEIVQEIMTLSSVKGHPNIVSYEDHKVIEHTDKIGWDILIRMELLTPLTQYLLSKSLTEREVARAGAGLASALGYCHSKNLIHRDIKPENIFVDEIGQFKLGDFGVARTVEKTMGGLSKKGTDSYMAPEVYKGEAYGTSVDTYSLGLVLYRLLNNNRLPFMPQPPEPITFTNKQEALARRIRGEHISPPIMAGDKLSAIICKACEPDQAMRFHNGNEMYRALMEYVGQSVSMQNTYENAVGITGNVQTEEASETIPPLGDRTGSPWGSVGTGTQMDATSSPWSSAGMGAQMDATSSPWSNAGMSVQMDATSSPWSNAGMSAQMDATNSPWDNAGMGAQMDVTSSPWSNVDAGTQETMQDSMHSAWNSQNKSYVSEELRAQVEAGREKQKSRLPMLLGIIGSVVAVASIILIITLVNGKPVNSDKENFDSLVDFIEANGKPINSNQEDSIVLADADSNSVSQTGDSHENAGTDTYIIDTGDGKTQSNDSQTGNSQITTNDDYYQEAYYDEKGNLLTGDEEQLAKKLVLAYDTILGEALSQNELGFYYFADSLETVGEGLLRHGFAFEETLNEVPASIVDRVVIMDGESFFEEPEKIMKIRMLDGQDAVCYGAVTDTFQSDGTIVGKVYFAEYGTGKKMDYVNEHVIQTRIKLGDSWSRLEEIIGVDTEIDLSKQFKCKHGNYEYNFYYTSEALVMNSTEECNPSIYFYTNRAYDKKDRIVHAMSISLTWKE